MIGKVSWEPKRKRARASWYIIPLWRSSIVVKGHRKPQCTKNTWERTEVTQEDRYTRERSQETAVDKEHLREDTGPPIERTEVTQEDMWERTEDRGLRTHLHGLGLFCVLSGWEVRLCRNKSPGDPQTVLTSSSLGSPASKWCVCFFMRCNGNFLCTFKIIA
jgi:hypothetical protein